MKNIINPVNVNALIFAIGNDLQNGTVINTASILSAIYASNVNKTTSLFGDAFGNLESEEFMANLTEEQKDNFLNEVYTIYQYGISGKAEHNLKLLIFFLRGQIKNKNISIDDFHKYKEILANLTLDEIKLIAKHINDEEIVLFNHPQDKSIENKEVVNSNYDISIAYSLQGKGLIYVNSSKPGQGIKLDSLINMNSILYISSIRTSLLNDIFKNINLDLEDLL